MKVLSITKYVYALLALALVFGFTFDTGNSRLISNKDDVLVFSSQTGKKWIAPAIADKLENPFKGNKEATEKGKSLFKTNCVTCHGETGAGDGPGSAGLNPKPATLNSKEVQEQSDGALYWKITTGFPPTAMISWRSNLSDKQRWDLVNYIRELKKK